eukprot:15366923-Ditylum_brightwellii.AAC.1
MGNAATSPVVVPCGTCATVDVTSGETIDMPHGLEVLGKLVFPSSANLVINTTAVFVQGELNMGIPDNDNIVKLTFYGTEDVDFYPAEQCGGEGTGTPRDNNCMHKKNLSKKPFIVAGGKLDIAAVDPTCPSWTTLKDVGTVTPLEPQAPCDTTVGSLFSGDGTFESGTTAGFFTNGGTSILQVETDSDTGNKYMRQSARSSGNGGMRFDLDTSCTVDGREYQYSLRYRVKADPSKSTTQDPTGPIGLIGMISALKADGQWMHQHFIYCDNATPGDWSATCNSNVISMTSDFHTATTIHVSIVPTSDIANYAIEYDDVQFQLIPPKQRVDTLLVSKEFGRCVKPGEEILVTSNEIGAWDNQKVLEISSIVMNDADNTATLNLVEDVTETFSTEASVVEFDETFPVEVARLNRQVVFEAQKDDVDSLLGGHLMFFAYDDGTAEVGGSGNC